MSKRLINHIRVCIMFECGMRVDMRSGDYSRVGDSKKQCVELAISFEQS